MGARAPAGAVTLPADHEALIEDVPQPRPPGGFPSERNAVVRQLSQWGYLETRELVELRAHAEKTFVLTKDSSRTIWKVIARRMRERGYTRTPKQCAKKWRVLVNRYRDKKTAGEEDSKPFPPFYEELDEIYSLRADTTERVLLDSQVEVTAEARDGGDAGAGAGGGGAGIKFKAKHIKEGDLLRRLDDDGGSGGDADEGEDGDEEGGKGGVDIGGVLIGGITADSLGKGCIPQRKLLQAEIRRSRAAEVVLERFLAHQEQLEAVWQEAVEARLGEVEELESEWRDAAELRAQERADREDERQQARDERHSAEEQWADRRDRILQALVEKLVDQ